MTNPTEKSIKEETIRCKYCKNIVHSAIEIEMQAHESCSKEMNLTHSLNDWLAIRLYKKVRIEDRTQICLHPVVDLPDYNRSEFNIDPFKQIDYYKKDIDFSKNLFDSYGLYDYLYDDRNIIQLSFGDPEDGELSDEESYWNAFPRDLVPKEINQLKNLEKLVIFFLEIESLESLCDLSHLTDMTIWREKYRRKVLQTRLLAIPEAIHKLSNLRMVDLSYNTIQNLDRVFALPHLKILCLTETHIQNIPENNIYCFEVEKLVLSRNEICTLPRSLTRIAKLHYLDLSKNNIEVVPDWIGEFTDLEILDLSDNSIPELPEAMGQLRNLKVLKVEENGLQQLPNSIGALGNLEELFLYNNQLSSLPDAFSELKALKSLSINNNELENIPDSIGKLQNLWSLSIGDNKLRGLPHTITGLHSLKILWIGNNLLSTLPDLSCLTNLIQLDLTDNPLKSIPDTIENLPAIKYIFVDKKARDLFPATLRKKLDF